MYKDLRLLIVLAALCIFFTAQYVAFRRRCGSKIRSLSADLSLLEKSLNKAESEFADCERRRRSLEASVFVKDRFLADTTQYLSDPIQDLSRLSEALDRTDLTTEQRRLALRLRTAAQRLSFLSADMQTAAAAGELSLESADFDLQEVADMLEPLLRRIAEVRGLSLRFRVEGGERSFRADKRRISQIVIGLASFAAKYIPQGAVSVRLFATDRDLEIAVFCCGPDSPDSDRGLMLNPFSSSGEETLPGQGGIEAGLPIVKSLTDLMGGSLRIESSGATGPAFFVLLPLPSVLKPRMSDQNHMLGSERPASAISAARSAMEEVPMPQERSRLRGLNVLVAEDEAINRMYLVRILSSAGLIPSQVKDGESALETYRSSPGSWDLVLMDMSMPRMSGLDAAREIRRTEAENDRSRVPIIALTAHSRPDDRAACAEAGMDGFLSKPFVERVFWMEIERVLDPLRAAAARIES